MRSSAETAREMSTIYPGDIDHSLMTDAYLLDKAAAWLERWDWVMEEERFRESLPKMIVEYDNDNQEKEQ